MLTKSKEFLELRNKARNAYSEEKMLDIIIFGSAAKDKIEPNDIDLAVIFKTAVDKWVISRLQAMLGERFHISALTADNFFTRFHTLSRTLLFEGVSLISNKKLSELYGLSAKVFYSYGLKGENESKKVRIVYLLRGRPMKKELLKHSAGNFCQGIHLSSLLKKTRRCWLSLSSGAFHS